MLNGRSRYPDSDGCATDPSAMPAQDRSLKRCSPIPSCLEVICRITHPLFHCVLSHTLPISARVRLVPTPAVCKACTVRHHRGPSPCTLAKAGDPG